MLSLNADAQQNLVVEVLYQREQIAALTAALAAERARVAALVAAGNRMADVIECGWAGWQPLVANWRAARGEG